MADERDALPLPAISRKRELTEKIQGMTEEIEELKNEETAILRFFHKEEAVQRMAAQPNKRGTIIKQARKEISDTITAADTAPALRFVLKRKTQLLKKSARPFRKNCPFLCVTTQSQTSIMIYMRKALQIQCENCKGKSSNPLQLILRH